MHKKVRLEMAWKVKNSTCIKKIPHVWWKHKVYHLTHNSQKMVLTNNNQLYAQFLLYMFISILYIFRATLCLSSGESIVSIQHLVHVTLCRWSSGMQVGKELPDLHTGRSPTQSDVYQMLYWYNWRSWWWAQGCSKHVKNRNKYTVCFTTLGHNCRRWFPRSLWWKKYI